MVPGIEAVVFDMDGVLVDVAGSYRVVIVATVRELARRVLGMDAPVEPAWAEALKRAGGFNNDWELTSALLRALDARGDGLDVARLEAELRDAGGGPAAVTAILGPPRPELSVEGGVRDAFQRGYLGEPRYIDRETPIPSIAALAAVPGPRAVATGRPRPDAEYTLRRFDFEPLFSAMVTHDDAEAAGMPGKPDPWILLEAARRLGVSGRCAYVGDTPDDMRAAGAAHWLAIGISDGRPDRERALRAAGADEVLAHTDEVQGLFE